MTSEAVGVWVTVGVMVLGNWALLAFYLGRSDERAKNNDKRLGAVEERVEANDQRLSRVEGRLGLEGPR